MKSTKEKAEAATICSLHQANSTVDVISVLHSNRNLPMAKTWQTDGTIKPYSNAKYFNLEQVPVKDIHGLSVLLVQLEVCSNTCIIRGKYLGDDQAKERTTTEYKQGKVLRRDAVFDDQPLHTILIEVDDFEPRFLGLSIDDPSVSIEEYIIFHLPKPFASASYHWQLSNSAGHPTKEGKLKVHLWFWLAVPRFSAELKAWAQAENLEADHSVFNPIQVHYTAAPIFEKDQSDPIPVRSGFVQKEHDAVVIDIQIEINEISRLTRINNRGNSSEHLKEAADTDPRLQAIIKAGLYERDLGSGKHSIRCPYEHLHSDPDRDGGDGDTAYFQPYTNGYSEGWIHCLHTHGNDQTKYWETIGYDPSLELFENIETYDAVDSLPDISSKSDIINPKFYIEYPPGLVGKIAEYIYRSSRKPVKSFAIAAALATISQLNANRAYVKKSDTALNLYQCLIGDTGKGKEDPRKAIKRLLDVVRSFDQSSIHESISSGAALLRSLENKPNTLILIDEFGLYLQVALSDKGSTHQKEFIKELMTLFSAGRSFFGGKSYANTNQNIERIDNPYINLVGTTTPSELFEGITVRAIDNGFLNRFIFIQTSEENPTNREPDIQVCEELKQGITDITRIFGVRESIELDYEPGAHNLLIELVEKDIKKGQFANLWSRGEEMTIRVAGLVALGDGEVIKCRHVQWAWHYVDASIKAFAQRLERDLSENLFQKQVAKALDLIAMVKDYCNDRQFGKFCKRGYMPRGKLTKLLKIKSREVDDIVKFLEETQQITVVKVENVTCFSVL